MKGQEIKELREGLNLSTARFSDELNISESYLNKIESGEKEAQIDLIERINKWKDYKENTTTQKDKLTEMSDKNLIIEQTDLIRQIRNILVFFTLLTALGIASYVYAALML
jgi:transcriptional regulator with XRE-family HTH domain